MRKYLYKFLFRMYLRTLKKMIGSDPHSFIGFKDIEGKTLFEYPLTYPIDLLLNTLEYCFRQYDVGEFYLDSPVWSMSVKKHG